MAASATAESVIEVEVSFIGGWVVEVSSAQGEDQTIGDQLSSTRPCGTRSYPNTREVDLLGSPETW